MAHPSGEHVADRADASARQRSTVVVLDDDPHLLAKLKRLLHSHGFQVVCAQTSRAARDAAASQPVSVALIDYRLRGVDGLTVAALLRREYGIPFVLMSGYLHTDLTVHAMKCGAFDVVDKPLREHRLLAALRGAISTDADAPPVDYLRRFLGGVPEEESVSSRWAGLMLNGCTAGRDPKTVGAVARAARVSTPVFRSVCDMCGVRPSKACWLCRFLRAISRSQQDRSTIFSHLDFGDRRTAEHSFRLAGLELTDRAVSLQRFFQGQQFVSTDLECLRDLAHRAANSPLFLTDEWDE